MNHLVVGGSGMLGQALLRELAQRKCAAVGASLEGPDYEVDLRDVTQIDEVVTRVEPDIIWNAAAIVNLAKCENDPELAYLVNARAVAVLTEAAKKTAARLVHISTDHFFSGDGDTKHEENAPVRLLNEYARTKYAGERFALTEGDALVFRTNITGFRNWTDGMTFAEWVFKAIEDDLPVTMFDDYFTSTLDVATFSRAACDLVEKKTTGLLNLASSEVAHKRAFIEAVADRLGCVLSHGSSGSVKPLLPKRAESLGLDVGRAEALLGRRLPGLAEVADALVAEYRGEK